MKNYTFILLLAAIAFSSCNPNRKESCLITAKVSATIEKINSGEMVLSAEPTLLDSYYGMERSETEYCYTYGDSRLESSLGITKKEIGATWYNNINREIFYCSLGLYIDKEFPSPAVFRRIEEAMDTTLISGLTYFHHIDQSTQLEAREKNIPQNTAEIFDLATSVFDGITQTMLKESYGKISEEEYIADGRLSFVAHKIAEIGDLSTYLIGESYDYNGSNGAPYCESYYTIDNETGCVITAENIIKRKDEDSFKMLVFDKLCEYYSSIGRDTSLTKSNVDWLWESKSGIALINEGILIYFHPYTIGEGALGQINLIIPYNELRIL